MSFEDELLKLDNQLCFRLYAASRQVTRLYRPLLDELGLTYPQYLVLLALWQWEAENDGTPNTVGRISDRLLLDAGTLTPLLRRMEEAGLLRRERTARDGREVHVTLTRAGRALKKRAARVPQALVCEPGLPVNEIPALQAGLGRLLAALAGRPGAS
ncbi:MAG: MarR family winged helix-turn-helix transcriptional regulator [Pseudomonadota bacterium]